jgi:aminoglycoside phosphotransferase (APT) family kinase protein
MSWHIEPGLFRGIGGLDLKSLCIPTEDAYIDRYSERTGISINKDDFRFYLAYNMFRMAGILQGIMKRYQDGTASSEEALRNGQAARPMAEMGWDYASGKRSI